MITLGGLRPAIEKGPEGPLFRPLHPLQSQLPPEQQLMAAEKEAGSIREFCADESHYPLQKLVANELSLDDANAVIRYHAALRSTEITALRGRLEKESDSDVRVALPCPALPWPALAWSLRRSRSK